MDTKSLNDISLGETMSCYSVKVNNIKKDDKESSNEKQDYSKDEIEDFKQTAKKYFKLDDELKMLQKKMTILRKEKIKCSKDILEFMENNSIKDINTNSGKLRYTVTYKKGGLNKKFLKSKLAEYFKNNDKALECYKFIDNRDKIEQTKLKRL